VLNGTQIGTFHWANGDTATGGQGTAIDGVNCATSEAYHIHSHLSIYMNGVQMALPSQVGIVPTCTYDLHTHDRSGVIHVEADVPATYTLGQFFTLWGQPLANGNVAGLTDPSMVVYVNDADGTAGPQVYSGDVTQLELAQHREITIVLGAVAPPSLQTYDWSLILP
jgi:hypothetical protein